MVGCWCFFSRGSNWPRNCLHADGACSVTCLYDSLTSSIELDRVIDTKRDKWRQTQMWSHAWKLKCSLSCLFYHFCKPPILFQLLRFFFPVSDCLALSLFRKVTSFVFFYFLILFFSFSFCLLWSIIMLNPTPNQLRGQHFDFWLDNWQY